MVLHKSMKTSPQEVVLYADSVGLVQSRQYPEERHEPTHQHPGYLWDKGSPCIFYGKYFSLIYLVAMGTQVDASFCEPHVSHQDQLFPRWIQNGFVLNLLTSSADEWTAGMFGLQGWTETHFFINTHGGLPLSNLLVHGSICCVVCLCSSYHLYTICIGHSIIRILTQYLLIINW